MPSSKSLVDNTALYFPPTLERTSFLVDSSVSPIRHTLVGINFCKSFNICTLSPNIRGQRRFAIIEIASLAISSKYCSLEQSLFNCLDQSLFGSITGNLKSVCTILTEGSFSFLGSFADTKKGEII